MIHTAEAALMSFPRVRPVDAIAGTREVAGNEEGR
jgi:hypothetical protein